LHHLPQRRWLTDELRAMSGAALLRAWLCAALYALSGCAPRDDRAVYGAHAEPGYNAGSAALDCSEARAGCACAGNQPPIACRPDDVASGQADGMCEEGTRHCRGGVFGACEGVRSYAPPAPAQAALIDPNLAHARCSDCDPNCFRVRDDLDPAEGPLASAIASGLSYHSSGSGLTLTPAAGSIGKSVPDAEIPAGSLFLEIAEGFTGNTTYAASMRPAHSDVYLLLDQSLSMAEATAWLYDRFDSGTLIDDAARCGNQAASVSGGVAGALRCITDSPELGLGMFRDIPFEPYATDEGLPAALREADAKREVSFHQQVAQSNDLTRVKTGLGQLGGVESSGDPDRAGSQIVALASIASRNGSFMGFDRTSIPDAAACSGSRIGYPCFRSGSPIVVLVTDAPFHNGPSSVTHAYDYASNLTIASGAVPGQTAVPSQNDTWSDAYALSTDAANSIAAFYGTTSALHADVSAALAGCGADDAAKDAVFRFDVVVAGGAGATAHVVLSTEGSSFSNAISVFDGIPHASEALPSAGHANELFSSAYDLGDMSGRDVVVSGDTSAGGAEMHADYQSALFGGACGTSSRAPDAAFAFGLSAAAAPSQVELQLDSGSAHGVLSIYAQSGALPAWPARENPIVASDNFDALPANVFTIPSGAGSEYVSVIGDTAASRSSFDAGVFGAGVECAPDASSKDVAFKIHVDGTHRLRFDTEGSSFDGVLALYSSPPPTKTDLPMSFDGYVTCNASVIERVLSDGDYYLVLKGAHVEDAGSYTLTVRDVDLVTTNELACDAGLGSGDPARVTFTAMPGTSYYALVKGDTALASGAYTLHVRDLTASSAARLACDAGSGAGGSSRLDLQLATGSYYAVLKGRAASDAGDYRLAIGGVDPVQTPFSTPGYDSTVSALHSQHIRVGIVLACNGGAACDDAGAQAQQLAQDTRGVVRRAADAADVPLQIVKAVQTLESFDTVSAQLLFMPDANPGFTRTVVTPLADAVNGCTGTTDATGFRTCVPGANPSFGVALTNPALAPVAPASGSPAAYHFTLRVSGRRGTRHVLTQDVPLYVAVKGSAPPGTYSNGRYQQDFNADCAAVNQRPSWDRLTFDADVRPDTRLTFYACSADNAADLSTCDNGGPSSGYKRVVTVSAGSGSGQACSVAAQAQDCPNGYCSPYTTVCNELEGATCDDDEDCPGTGAGRCRAGANAAMLGNTCKIANASADPSSALGGDNFRAFMRVRSDLESLGDGSRTPALFFWESQYRCRDVE
jgi:hypothetical protein